MAQQTAIATPSVVINNRPVAILSNSFMYTEGFGESSVRVQSAGGNSVQQVYSENAETKLSKVTFSMLPTSDNVELVRDWKFLKNSNSILVTGEDGFTRSFNNASLTSNYEVNLQVDGVIDLEWMTDAAI